MKNDGDAIRPRRGEEYNWIQTMSYLMGTDPKRTHQLSCLHERSIYQWVDTYLNLGYLVLIGGLATQLWPSVDRSIIIVNGDLKIPGGGLPHDRKPFLRGARWNCWE